MTNFRVGDRVRLKEDYSSARAGHLVTVSWLTNNNQYPIRVRWDNHEQFYQHADIVFGMDDAGWLMAEGEVEAAE